MFIDGELDIIALLDTATDDVIIAGNEATGELSEDNADVL